MEESVNSKSMLKVGTILRGMYRIDSYLSSGGFGNTYVATNIEFEVAIKEFFMKGVTQRDDNQTTISVSNAENHNSFLEQKEKFKKEARRLRKLKNEHIVKVHDLFEENGTAYYVMDYVDGENLAERLKRMGRSMTESEVRLILPQILDALKAVHDAGIWHLDLKPANILLEKGGNVKLIDFGASKQLNAQKGGATTSTAISYTNGYAPREQMEQNYDKFGPWTDIYALGATLYNLLTNKRPPLPTDIDDDISEDKHEALPFPENVGGLRFLVLQMMKTNRLQRPQTIGAIMEAEKSRREEPKQTPKQQPTSQHTSDFDDEETIIAEPQSKHVERRTIEPNTNNSIGGNDKEPYIGKSLLVFGIIIFCSILAVLLYISYTSNASQNDESTDAQTSQVEISGPETVDKMPYQTSIGYCEYSGLVDDNNKPHGTGEAFFNDGRYYKGGFEHGVLTGDNCYFKYANGDEFQGTFRDNSFYYGTYTIAEDGSYYTGSYRKGKPIWGTWYDKNGHVVENIR